MANFVVVVVDFVLVVDFAFVVVEFSFVVVEFAVVDEDVLLLILFMMFCCRFYC